MIAAMNGLGMLKTPALPILVRGFSAPLSKKGNIPGR